MISRKGFIFLVRQQTNAAKTATSVSVQRPKSTSTSSRLKSIYIPKSQQSHPGRRITESYIHAASSTPYLATTLADLLDFRAETDADNIGYVVSHQKIRKTYSQLKADADKLAAGFIRLGLQPGDRIGIWGPNSYEWIVTMFAASKAGLILVNVNPAYKVHELEYCINKVQMKAIVAAEGVGALRYYEHFKELIPSLSGNNQKSNSIPCLQTIIMMTNEPSKFPGTIPYNEVSNIGTRDEMNLMEAIARKVQPDDPFNIQFTSGTTGSPKGATLSYFGLMNAAYFVGLRMNYCQGEETKSSVCPLPLYHVFGCVGNLVLSTIFGSKVVFPSERFDAEATLRAISDEKANCVSGVPTMWKDMLDHPNFDKYDYSSLRLGIMGGAPCPPETVRRAQEKMGLKQFTCGYGSTEQSLATYFGFSDDPASLSTVTTGYPLDHVEAKIVDTEGRIVPCGQKGELLTRGFGTMLGYWQDEAKTKETIRADRWMHSGDLATMDERGYLKIVGRLKDMVIRGGENVYPTEIENVLHISTLVGDVHVCGIPDQRLGEELVAWVRLKDNCKNMDETEAEEQLKKHCQKELANYKVPKYFIFYDAPADIPMTITGKVQKFRLSEKSVERIEDVRNVRLRGAAA